MRLHPFIIWLPTKTESASESLSTSFRVRVLKCLYILLYRQIRFLPACKHVFLWFEGPNVKHFDEWSVFGRDGFLFTFHVELLLPRYYFRVVNFVYNKNLLLDYFVCRLVYFSILFELFVCWFMCFLFFWLIFMPTGIMYI